MFIVCPGCAVFGNGHLIGSWFLTAPGYVMGWLGKFLSTFTGCVLPNKSINRFAYFIWAYIGPTTVCNYCICIVFEWFICLCLILFCIVFFFVFVLCIKFHKFPQIPPGKLDPLASVPASVLTYQVFTVTVHSDSHCVISLANHCIGSKDFCTLCVNHTTGSSRLL